MLRPRTAGFLASCALATYVACTAVACGETQEPTDGQVEGALLAKALLEDMKSSSNVAAPYRCARFPLELGPPNTVGVGWNESEASIVIEPAGKSPRFAVISDFSEELSQDRRSLEALRTALNEAKIDAVYALGSLGKTASELETTLGALADGAAFPILTIPGDRESMPQYRLAISNLINAGARIVDASRYRIATIGPLRLVTMPGISKAANLVSVQDGCLHNETDVQVLLDRIPESDAPTVLLSYAPWRQTGQEASDFGLGAIHSGEIELEALQASGRFGASIHGMLSPRDREREGSIHLGQPPSAISTMTGTAGTSFSSALLVEVSGAKLAWKRLPVH